jgi:hypothetical protein
VRTKRARGIQAIVHTDRLTSEEDPRPAEERRRLIRPGNCGLPCEMVPRSADRLHVEASKYVSPPEVAPHCTAGTVDLTLCEADGVELDMGTEVNASPEASRNACFTDTRSIPAHARRNRAVLVEALTAAGMVNYPTEWWHWSTATAIGRTRPEPTPHSTVRSTLLAPDGRGLAQKVVASSDGQ